MGKKWSVTPAGNMKYTYLTHPEKIMGTPLMTDDSLTTFTDLTSCPALYGFISHANSDQLTGSSHANGYFSYDRSRLNTIRHGPNGDGWQAGSTSVGEYIQADFGTVRRLENVITQGWSSNLDYYYVTSYRFAYSVDDVTYTFVSNPDGSDKIFTGNADDDTPVQNDFNPVLVARYVRLHPQTWHGAIALRWDVSGCDIGEHFLCLSAYLPL